MGLYKSFRKGKREKLMSGDAMSTAIAALETAGLTGSALWGEVGAAAGLIVTCVVFAFGYRVVSKIIKGASKGKVRM